MFETHLIPHRISLKAKLLPEVEEYFLYFLLRKWDRVFIPPGGVELTASVVLRCPKVTQIWRQIAPIVETFLMGPNAVRRPHGPSRCLVDLEIWVVMFKRWEMGGNTNGGRNRLNQRHYSLSRTP